MTLLSY